MKRGNFSHVNASPDNNLYEWSNDIIEKYINHQQAKLDKANEEIERTALLAHKLYEDNQGLIEALKLAVEVIEDLINKTEYGVNQWQAAWAPNEETEPQKSIKRARQFLESEQYKKVEGSL